MALTSLLEAAFPGARILVAATGKEGIALAGQHRPDAIEMDVSLPGMNGIEATLQIRALLPTVAIIMCSLSDTTKDCAAAMRAGADAWVMKDEAAEELVPTIRRPPHHVSTMRTHQHDRPRNLMPIIAVFGNRLPIPCTTRKKPS